MATRIGSLRRAVVATLICLVATPAPAAPKTDVVVLRNGNQITGEIKELSYGQLMLKTDDMGTVYVEWDKIVSLQTTQLLQVELADGRRFFGAAPVFASTPATIRLLSGKAGETPVAVELSTSEVVRMATTFAEERWYQRLDGSVSAGYSYTQTNSLQVFSFAGEVGSRTNKRKWNIAIDNQTTTQATAAASERASLEATLERFMLNRYYREGAIQFSRNQELGLKLRSLVGATYGRYLLQRPGREWRAGGGLAASAEDSTDGSHRKSLEAQLNSSLRVFRFDSPKVDVTAGVTLLPSLSDWGRVRGEVNVNARYELIHDLFFELTLNDSYDNTPSTGSQTNDWNVVTSIGYSF